MRYVWEEVLIICTDINIEDNLSVSMTMYHYKLNQFLQVIPIVLFLYSINTSFRQYSYFTINEKVYFPDYNIVVVVKPNHNCGKIFSSKLTSQPQIVPNTISNIFTT